MTQPISPVNTNIIFLAGLHRSGTSLLHEIIREHPEISGFSNTGVPEDEGQHLQTVYKPALCFGGPGKFVYDNDSYMDEHHPLASEANARMILSQWNSYVDLSHRYLIEKSPPNLIRTRFLQKLFPKSKFVAILRHPIAVSYATKKWAGTSINALLEHTLLGYEIFLRDMQNLNSCFVLRYEEFVSSPQVWVDQIFTFLELETISVEREIRDDVNEKYFSMWERDRTKFLNRIRLKISNETEKRANRCGYSLERINKLEPVRWLGSHERT